MHSRYLLPTLLIIVCLIAVSPTLADETAPLSFDHLLSPEQRALRQIQEEGRQRVRDLTRRHQRGGPGQETRELARQTVLLKREYEQLFLDARAALDRGPALTPDASAAWTPDGVPVCTTAGEQTYPIPVADGAGGVFVIWVDGTGNDQVYVKRITAAGTTHPGWPAAGTPVSPPPPDTQRSATATGDGSGGVLVTWEQRDPILGDWDVYAQRITGTGAVATGWSAAGESVGVTSGDQVKPAIVTDGAGGAIVAWWDFRTSGAISIYAARVTSAGAVPWTPNGEWVTSDTNTLARRPPSICSDGLSGVYLAWESEWVGASSDLYTQRLDSNGQVPTGWPVGGENFVPTGTHQANPDLVSDGSGGVIVAWEDDRSTTDNDIYAIRVTSGSSIYSGWTSTGVPVSAAAGSQQLEPHLISDGAGGAIITWTDLRHTNAYIFCTKVTGAGVVVWAPGNNGMRLCFDTALQANPRVCSDGEGGLIAVWEDYRAPNPDIYCQHITADGRYAYSLDGVPLCTDAAWQGRVDVAAVAPQGAIAVFEDSRNSATTGTDIYAQQIDGLCNLTPITSNPGWSSPLVPRNAAGATHLNCVVTPTLDGNVATTYSNFLIDLAPYPLPVFHSSILIDDDTELLISSYGDGFGPEQLTMNDLVQQLVRGGRHTLYNVADYYDDIPESDEDDNIYSEQYVWSPLVLQKEIPVLRQVPPVRGDQPTTNCDGFKFVRTSGVAWVTGVAPLSPGDDYDLYVYSDYSGSTSGFSIALGSSIQGDNLTEFVVGHFDSTPLDVYPGVVRYDAPHGDEYVADQSDAAARQGGATGAFTHQLMNPGRIVDVYEVNLTGGQTYYFSLERLDGVSDIAFQVFPATAGTVYGRDSRAEGISKVLNAGIDTLTYTAANDGYYPVVVYRDNGTDAMVSEVLYSLVWDTAPVIDVPEDVSPSHQLAFVGVTPNPMMGNGRVRFTLAERGPVRLTVFDLRGRRVGTLLDEAREPGPHSINWDGRADDGRRLGAGIYWLRLETGGQVITKRAVILN